MQKILVSVDTEAPVGTNAVDKMIYGKTREGEYGIFHLMKLFEEYDIKALFFVDIPEMKDHGEKKIRKVIEDIKRSGHDVGVHIHPDHMSDEKRRYLWQYSKEEQYGIISRCTEYYNQVTGKMPVSFRAGRYGANNDTLEIIASLGYKYDMSEFYRSRYCKISPHITCNRVVPFRNTSLKEVPVTTYKSLSIFGYERNDQISPGMNCYEFKTNLQKIIKSEKVDVISLLFHSFQFIDWRNNPDNPVFNKKKYNTVRKNLSFISQCPTEYISEKDLEKIHIDNNDCLGDLDLSKGLLPKLFFARTAVRVIHDKLVLNV